MPGTMSVCSTTKLIDVAVVFQVEKSRTFRREGADIHSDVVVSLSQAILGGTVRIPGITDNILLNVSLTPILSLSMAAAQLCWLKPKFHYADFAETFP